jgi:integrase
MTKLLTSAAASKIKAGRDRIERKDGGTPGLYLAIYPTGLRSFAMKFRRPNGKLARLTLGYYDPAAKGNPVEGGPLSLPMARALAAEINRQRAIGLDVIEIRHRSKLEKQARVGDTFGDCARDFVNQYAKRENRRWRDSIRLLGLVANGDELETIPKGLVDRWGDRPIADIDGDDVHFIIDEAREKGVPGLVRKTKGKPSESMARALHAALSMMFSWLVAKRRLRVSPVKGVAKPKASNKRDRVLGDDEIKKFWQASEEIGKPVQQVLKILLLTGCRMDEIRELRRDELSADGETAIIGGDRTKNKRAHVVPLSPLCWSLIESVEAKGDFVFSISDDGPVAIGSIIKAKLDASMKVKAWQFRDLRRTAATGMAELGISPHIIEACLNHVSGAKASVAGIYNRAAYLPEKKAALNRWASHVLGIVSGGSAKVVQMRNKNLQ